MSDPSSSRTFETELRMRRASYYEKRQNSNLHPPLNRPIVDVESEKISRHTFWYEDKDQIVRCLRIYDVPGTLSGDLLRLTRNLPAIEGDCEVEGDVVRPLHIAPTPPRPPEGDDGNWNNDSEDTSALVDSLPVVDASADKHFLKRPKYQSEIRNLLKCQGGNCPGTPLSPHVIGLLGKTKDGMLVFPKLLPRQFVIRPIRSVGFYKSWFLQLLKGLKVLHAAGIIHRDLRPENLVFSEDAKTLVICDIESRWGNRAAPEILHNRELDAGWSEKSDIWDVGDCIKDILLGNTPINSVVNWAVPSPFAQIVEACQKIVPAERASIDELIEMLEAL